MRRSDFKRRAVDAAMRLDRLETRVAKHPHDFGCRVYPLVDRLLLRFLLAGERVGDVEAR